MGRLTERGNIGYMDSDKLPSYVSIYEKLREYENAEENGKQRGHLCDEITIQRGSLMELVNQLCMEYLHTNMDKSSGDVGYQLGMKDGISGIREYICNYIYSQLLGNK